MGTNWTSCCERDDARTPQDAKELAARVQLDFAPRGLTGDGLSDPAHWDHPRHEYLLSGAPGPDLFSQQPQAFAIAVPNDEEYTWLVDLKQGCWQADILMHHPFTLRDAHGLGDCRRELSRIG